MPSRCVSTALFLLHSICRRLGRVFGGALLPSPQINWAVLVGQQGCFWAFWHKCSPAASKPLKWVLRLDCWVATAGVIMTELGRHIEKSLNPVLKLTLKAALTWAFKSIPQVRWCCACFSFTDTMSCGPHTHITSCYTL
jgi:hypothetical protein